MLALEIPYEHGIENGMIKQWNDQGELLGSFEINKGTGTYSLWHQNGGFRGEISLVDGKFTGRQRTYWADGVLGAESFWLENEKVSKKRYREACEENPRLPRYDDEPRPSKKKSVKEKTRDTVMPATTAKEYEELAARLLKGSRVREALSWLEESQKPSRSLGEATGQSASLQLVRKLYALGAVSVHAVEIDGAEGDDQNTGRLVIELPKDDETREKLLQFCGRLARKLGFDPDPDVGQRYILLMLD
jgi:hypothetical protein